MKKQIHLSIEAHVIRGAFYLLLLITVCAIPFAFAQRNGINRAAARQTFKPKAIAAHAAPSGVRQRGSAPTGVVCSDYTTSTSTDTIVPGDTDTGNHCDDCTSPITFPFPVSVYGTSFTSALVGSNGSLQFTGDSDYFGSDCPLPNPGLDESILPYQDDLSTDPGISPDCSTFVSGCGVFTSVTGTAPNRVFNIEWRTGYFGRSGTANFEVRFSENNPSCFDVIYGSTVDDGLFEVSGVQQSTAGPGATTFSCGAATLTNGLKVTYCCSSASPTPTPSPTPTGTPVCVFGEGYWKNHPGQWPVTSLQLGNFTYNQQQLLSIFNQPVGGNGLILLARQEITVKLNVANGADGSCIQQTLTDADALIGNLVVPPIGTGFLRPRDVSALMGTLGDYNGGVLCAPSCGATASPTATAAARGRPAPVARPLR